VPLACIHYDCRGFVGASRSPDEIELVGAPAQHEWRRGSGDASSILLLSLQPEGDKSHESQNTSVREAAFRRVFSRGSVLVSIGDVQCFASLSP